MAIELYARRLEGVLELVSACASVRGQDPLICLLAQRAESLFEFDHLSILLCDDSRQIQKAIVIQSGSSYEVSPDDIPLSEMDLILQTLITGSTSNGATGLCTPMVFAGRLIGVICLTSGCERYRGRDVRLIQFLSDTLAVTFERLARGSISVEPVRTMPTEMDLREASVTKNNAVSLRLSFLAQHDGLTGLPNRCLLFERLSRALASSRRYGRRLAVLFLDLDRFKEINDSHGHAVGDQALRQVSNRLVSCVRASDTVSRIGGDEFVILLAELELENSAAICAQKIIAAITTPIKTASYELHLAVSIGIGIYPGDGDEAEALIRNADIAMYQAKGARNGEFQFFNPDLNVPAYRQRA